MTWGAVFVGTILLIIILGDARHVPARQLYPMVDPAWRVLMFPSREALSVATLLLPEHLAVALGRVLRTPELKLPFFLFLMSVGFAFWVGAVPWIVARLLLAVRRRAGRTAE